MRYLVTGATGFIGGTVVRRLRARGDEVVAVVRDPARAHHLSDRGVQVLRGDVGIRSTLDAAMDGVDAVFHVAGWYRIGSDDRAGAWSTNVDGTRNVLDAMARAGVARGVYTSTLAVNSDTHGVEVDETYRFVGRHLSLYDATKAEAHRIAEARISEGLPLVIVMPGLVYGPGDTSAVRTTLRQFLRGRLPAIPNGTAYSWAHVEDIADAHVRAMDAGRAGESYIIAGPTHTLREAMDLAAQVADRRAPVGVPPRVLRAAGALAGLAERIAPLPEQYRAESLRVTSGPTYIGSNAKARRELGYAPRPLAEGWTQTVRQELATLD